MNHPNLLIVMTDHQRADTALSEHPSVGLAPYGSAEGFRKPLETAYSQMAQDEARETER